MRVAIYGMRRIERGVGWGFCQSSDGLRFGWGERFRFNSYRILRLLHTLLQFHWISWSFPPAVFNPIFTCVQVYNQGIKNTGGFSWIMP